eukprot:TRINITY_DN91916_c0_g1_i1.p1 TRINITY_DN91916_c0_g1~~TRINITY_DN91916_c0_g1_i1.p1  ORF type:complete len:236 (+),score=71.38 TRINITY_DN91916_c0_g1_i1:59-766(+)
MKTACVLALGVFASLAGARDPLTSSQRQAVGKALSDALGVMSGKVKSGSKYSICADMFPNGAPADAASNPSWNSCKSLIGTKRSSLLSKANTPLTTAQKEQVGKALKDALSALGPNGGSQSKYESCAALFSHGEKHEGALWESCKYEIGESLMQRAVQVLDQKTPITGQQRAEIGAALGTALKALQGKGSGNMYEICGSMFPEGKRDAATKEDDPTWVACKHRVFASAFVEVKKH